MHRRGAQRVCCPVGGPCMHLLRCMHLNGKLWLCTPAQFAALHAMHASRKVWACQFAKVWAKVWACQFAALYAMDASRRRKVWACQHYGPVSTHDKVTKGTGRARQSTLKHARLGTPKHSATAGVPSGAQLPHATKPPKARSLCDEEPKSFWQVLHPLPAHAQRLLHDPVEVNAARRVNVCMRRK